MRCYRLEAGVFDELVSKSKILASAMRKQNNRWQHRVVCSHDTFCAQVPCRGRPLAQIMQVLTGAVQTLEPLWFEL